MQLGFMQDWIQEICKEDAPYGDPSVSLFPADLKSKANITAKGEGIFCGEEMIRSVFSYLSPSLQVSIVFKDGDPVQKGDQIAYLEGAASDLLRGERIVLNLISYLSGISTETARFVKIAAPYGVKILDTRKTLPLYRELSKYAVKMGGGYNHRNSLSDLIMLKDNHITLLGGIDSAFEKLKQANRSPFLKIEVEVKNLKEALAALKYSPDIIMLDNFGTTEAEEAIYFLKDKVLVEISGGITLANLEDYAKLKPDFISVGSLTHHVRGLDFNMKFINNTCVNEVL